MSRLEEIESGLLDDRTGMTPETQRGIGWTFTRLKEAKAFYGQLIERPADTEWIHDRACEHLSKLEASDGEK